MSAYLGDFVEDGTVNFLWSTNDSDGASITRSGDGTIHVYKDVADGTEVTTGITNVEDFDSLTGIHSCTIDLNSSAFYAIGADYTVILKAATIDTQTVNAVLARFSIENRFIEVDVTKWLGQAVTLSGGNKPDVNIDEISDDATAASNLELALENGTAGYVASDLKYISGDSAAADNLELQYDGTGIVGDNFPSTQLQLAGIGAGVGLPQVAESSVVTDGSETNDHEATWTHDGTLWVVTDGDQSDPGIDAYLQHDLDGEDAIPLSFHFHGWYQDGDAPFTNTCLVQARNWAGSSWDTIETLSHATAEEEHNPTLNPAHVSSTSNGPGSDAGVIRIRFLQGAQDSGSGSKISVDHSRVIYSTAPIQVSDILSSGQALDTTLGVLDNVDTVDQRVTANTDQIEGSDATDQIRDACWSETATELTGKPAQGATFRDKFEWVWSLLSNKKTQNATTATLFKDDASTPMSTSTVSTDGTTVTFGEWAE